MATCFKNLCFYGFKINDFYSEKQLKLYEKKMKDEEEINKELWQMKEGEWVTYGNEIQLQHYDSKGKFSNTIL